MFRTLKSVSSKFTARRIALVVAPLAVLGATLSTASAADRDGWRFGRGRGPERDRGGLVIRAEIPAVQIVLGRQPEPRRIYDEVPSCLDMKAYQSGDQVIIVINGVNPTVGYNTSLEAGFGGSFVLHNTAPYDRCQAATTAFNVTGAICSPRELSRVCVRIGNQSFDVPVTCVRRIG